MPPDLVGSHAAEEALKRGHRVRALVRPTSDTRWLDEWGVQTSSATWKMPTPSKPASPAPIGCSTAPPRSATGERSKNSAGSTSRRCACCSKPPPKRGVERFVHVSSLGVYEGRDHYGTDETVPPAANSLDAYTRSKTEAEALVLEYHRQRGLPVAIVRPGFIYGERDRTVLPKLLHQPATRTLRLLRFG